jgi:hypothetical protein
MSERDPRCVHVLEDRATAAALAEWLTGKGYPADVFDAGVPREAADDSLGFSSTVAGGLEIRVLNPAQADEARNLLAEHAEALKELHERYQKRAQRTGTTTAVCEECGKSSEWPAAEMGRTQVCPHCSRYMDIPDPDDDWGDVDFGGEEPEAEPEEPEEK